MSSYDLWRPPRTTPSPTPFNITIVSPGGSSRASPTVLTRGRGFTQTRPYHPPDSDWDAPNTGNDSPPDSDDSDFERRPPRITDLRLSNPRSFDSGRHISSPRETPTTPRRPSSTPPIERRASQPQAAPASPTATVNGRPIPACVVCGRRPQRVVGNKLIVTCIDPQCALKLQKIQAGKAFGGGRERVDTEDNMCVVCHARPKYNNGRGKVYPTCGMTCAQILNPAKENQDENSLCDFCHKRPKFFDASKGILYPQCGRQCRDRSRAARAGTRFPPAAGSGQAPVPAGPIGDDTSCLNCWLQPKKGEFHFCGDPCAEAAKSAAPTLLEAPNGHATFHAVANTFGTAWKSTKRPCPTVKKVYKIIQRDGYRQMYTRYKGRVGKNSEFEAWFVPQRTCSIGNGGNTQLCPQRSACQLCSCINTALNAKEFAKGIPLTMMTNKADHFSTPSPKVPHKAMLLVKIAAGKTRYIPKGPPPSRAPSGFDSVAVTPTGNTIEGITVYDGEAIQPAYLVIYD